MTGGLTGFKPLYFGLIVLCLMFGLVVMENQEIKSITSINKHIEVIKNYYTNASNSKVCESSSRTECVDGILIKAWRPILNISFGMRIMRASIYLVCLCYMFLGVSIISDRFMASIEVITSQEKQVKIKRSDGTVERVNVRIWNETVSNLTLMALGSSAPEIMLSIIEIIGRDFNAGDLGPGTIVGSAAFNLFVIIGICVLVIPDNESRKIKHLSVFILTSIWSLFAYLWLYLIIAQISVGVVEIWEAFLTFIFFPLTVLTAYIADTKIFFNRFLKRRFLQSTIKSYVTDGGDMELKIRRSLDKDPQPLYITCNDSSNQDNSTIENYYEFERIRSEYLDIIREIRKKQPNIDHKKLQELAQHEIINREPKSRAFYKIQAIRMLTGTGDIFKRNRVEESINELKDILVVDSKTNPIKKNYQQIYFDPGHYTVVENIGRVHLIVKREGPAINNTIAEVDYYSEDGSAVKYDDYEPLSGRLIFGPGQSQAAIGIDIVDDDKYEEDEHFYVHLKNLSIKSSGNMDSNTPCNYQGTLVNPATATVMILDDDHPGIFHFEQPNISVSESNGSVNIKVVRSSGTRGHVSIPYKTIENTAFGSGEDYVDVEGHLEFYDDQSYDTIVIPLTDTTEYEKNKSFFVELGRPVLRSKHHQKRTSLQRIEDLGSRVIRRTSRGSERSCQSSSTDDLENNEQPKLGDLNRLEVHIRESKELKNVVDHLMKTGKLSKLLSTSSWKEQFKDALRPECDENDDEQEEEEEGVANNENNSLEDKGVHNEISPVPEKSVKKKKIAKSAYFMHYISVFWKVLFAFVPPTDFWGGWLTFIVSICMIAILTAFIGDLASGFGCTVGLTDYVTSISFVALGTSLPDTIASKVAAKSDPTADSSIGNVIGSNAVNVFLGIGIAWLIASCYHSYHGRQFLVPVGTLGFSVTLFCFLALIALVIMLYRRKKSIGGELGGPKRMKYATAFVFFSLWFIYVVVSSLENYCHISGF